MRQFVTWMTGFEVQSANTGIQLAQMKVEDSGRGSTTLGVCQ